MGYHLLHYLLCHAYLQTTDHHDISHFSDTLDPYDFSNAIFDWLEIDFIQPIPQQYLDHYISQYFLLQLLSDTFLGLSSLLCNIIDSEQAKAALPTYLTLQMLPHYVLLLHGSSPISFAPPVSDATTS